MLRRRPLARAGRPGIIGPAARSAVVAGTATAASGRVAKHQAEQTAAQQAAPAPAATPSPPARDAADLTEADISNLERLARLHEQGVLSDQELAVAKARILGT
ncbi:SHOCT domain-containing protein [Kitasatospora sp. NPDC048722]|uniref:SHOCT domain-containing protein n=1 Tax=Kitasatospora sp. NPDC048722 TaxID=3155639 RepID=UPI0033F2267B